LMSFGYAYWVQAPNASFLDILPSSWVSVRIRHRAPFIFRQLGEYAF
jgi:hypothetical protein